tara:strand:+ start:2437 stop:2793 length:357 start_codon:yes stop_codon:yes gene_type:complete
MIKISDIGLPYFESCPFCREKFYLCLNQLETFNKPQLLKLIKIYSDRPPLVYFHSLVSQTINANTDEVSETDQMTEEDTNALIHQHPNSVITNVNGEWTNMLGEVVNPEELAEQETEI